MAAGLFPAEPGHIGSDESGKGDFFGPLVIAAFFLPEGQEGVMRELGVKDSKRTSDARCREIAEALKRGYPYHSVISIGPERYNELWAKFRNLNRFLARAEFLTRLRYLSKDVGTDLPKGASEQVEAAAVKLVREKGPGILDKVAKTHFKTTVRVLAAAGVDRLV